MSLNALIDLELDHELDLFDEDLQGLYSVNEKALVDNWDKIKPTSMEEAAGEDCELLLTDYLLNFGEENEKDFSYDGCSSGVECSDSEDLCSLASLKKSLKKNKSDNVKVSLKSEKNTEDCKGVPASASPPVTSEEEKTIQKPNGDKESERKARDRVRSATYRANKTQKVRKLEEECEELHASNKALSEKNEALIEKISALEEQVEYLESVIVNESALSGILSTLAKHPGLEFQRNPLRLSSMKAKRKRKDDVGINEGENSTKKICTSLPHKNGGVCLHLAPGRMSLEFCGMCHKNSANVENE